MRQMEMRKNHPAWQKLRFSTQVVDHGIEAKKSQWKQTADERELDYKMELQKMKIRVESQPTLFERQSQKSARQQAEKRFKSVLEKGGVSEEEISRIISLSEN
eukprot:08499.XXX_169675_170379_1 [CDS] Oithona nana genome sequencing.